MVIMWKSFLKTRVVSSALCRNVFWDMFLFSLSSSIPQSVNSVFLLCLFWSFPPLVGAVKQKPMRPEGETVRRVILPLTDNTNARLRIIMFDWALVKETVLRLYLGTHIYSCCQTNPTSAFSSIDRNACFFSEVSHAFLKLYYRTVTGFMSPQSLKLVGRTGHKGLFTATSIKLRI